MKLPNPIAFFKSRRRLTTTLIILIALSGTGVYFRAPIISFVKTHLPSIEVPTILRVKTQEEAVIDVVDKASPAVVSIIQTATVFDPYSGPISQKQGIGTGFVVKENGVILTNRHVVSDKSVKYKVMLKDGSEYDVSEVHRDFAYDLAIIKVPASGLKTLTLGDSDNLKVGQTTVAIGNALGRYTNTVTTGVVSGIGRGIEASSGTGDVEYMDDVIQTDAALNPGNSGGPLLDLSAKVIGINVAIAGSADNIGFSIPINVAKPLLAGYEKHGRIVRPFLGVSYYVITDDEARLYDLPQGAYVQEVISGSGAAEAGVKEGDIITAVDGKKIEAQTALAKIIITYEVGDTVTLTISRQGKEITLKAKLTEAPAD